MSDTPIQIAEKSLCKKVWDTLNSRLDKVDYLEDAQLWGLWFELEEVLPYGPEEVKDD